MVRLIKSHADADMKGNNLIIKGTDVNQMGDLLADILLMIPHYVKGYGFVSWSVWLQAKEIYRDYYIALHEKLVLIINGHSLGAGIALLVALMLRRDGCKRHISIYGVGGVKCIGRRVKKFLERETTISWRVRHKDPVPYLGFWHNPETTYEGDKRKHIFDWDIKEHTNY